MKRYLFRRALQCLPVLAMVLAIGFALLRLMPGDPAVVALGEKATAAELEATFRELLGDMADAYTAQLVSIAMRLLTDGTIDWEAEGDKAEEELDRLRRWMDEDVQGAFPSLSAELRAILIAEAIRILLGAKPA
jgi:hypothetical protein